MVVRFAVVLWWLGALFLVAALADTAVVGSTQVRCRSVFAERDAWQAKADAAYRQAQTKSGAVVDDDPEIAAAFPNAAKSKEKASDEAILDAAYPDDPVSKAHARSKKKRESADKYPGTSLEDYLKKTDAEVDMPKRAGLDGDVARCESPFQEWLVPALIAVIGLPLLALAYILGGSFLRPPRPRPRD